MAFTDNFGNPKGLIGRLMLVAMEREHLPMARWAFTLFDVQDGSAVLDIGCGGGYNVRRILEKNPSGTVAGLDISEESVCKAKKINRAELGKRCEIVQGSVERLPFPDASFDLVTAFETVFFWNDVPAAMSEVRRVVRAGGSFAVVNNYGDPSIDWEKKVPCMKRRTAEEIQSLMENAGFGEVTAWKNGNLFCVIGKAGK